MDFKIIDIINKKPILYWFLIFIVMPSYAIRTNAIKDIFMDYDFFHGVHYNRYKKSYYTISAIRGQSKELFQLQDNIKIKPLIHLSSGNIHLSLLTYDEFFAHTKPLLQHIRYLDKLPQILNRYLQLLSIDVDEFNINLTFISSPFSLFFESQERNVSKTITLDFMSNLNQAQIENFAEYIGNPMIGTLAHESFHFLVAYAKYPKMPELREELYASLFGKCVSYEISSQITSSFTIEPYPKNFYINMKNDLKSIRKSTKKSGYFKSLQAELIAMYYFRYIIDDHFSPTIESDIIPRFCHKLFSEHNFKHPIEKKPPKWFKEFLEDNRR